MGNKVTVPLIFGIFGFLISFILSLISGSSFGGIFIKSLFSTLLLGGLGYLLVFLLDKYGNESIQSQNKANILNQTNAIKQDSNLYKREKSLNPDRENKISKEYDGQISEKISDLDENPISYEAIFSKLNEGENSNINEDSDENSKFNSQDIIKKSVIDELQKEKEKESIEIDLLNNTEIITGDTDLNPNSISAEDAAKISATSKMSSLAGEVKGIDDKYIYFSKGSKIENKPEKIAKIIKEMLKNE